MKHHVEDMIPPTAPAGGAPRASAVAALFLVAAASLAGCAGDEVLAPVPAEGQGGGGTTSSATTGGSTTTTSTGAGTPVREVFVRNPMGDQVGNLLADGDFELSITSNPGQQGWTFYGFQGAAGMVGETGGLCRSGLRCAVLPPGGTLFGRGTAAPDRAPMQGEVWVKPQEGGECGGVTIYALSCDAFGVLGQPTLAEGADDDGWCPRRFSIQPSSTAVCLYMENDSGTAVLVDQASVRPREGEDDTQRSLPAVRPATRARMDRLKDHLRRTLPLGQGQHDVVIDPRP